ncbi:alkylglycerol monooxygenase [Actimicrobium sp. GrIS 1.19]|uniref:sterol desaturase family protein n=1 Tax=Actimicrobium sp. GrIS 1.19 TaxID=3071708 RepID=UPI002DFB3CBE|nr:alkylglycerol monooxygenase [Actimicrobium sp. GrIS 1.19]
MHQILVIAIALFALLIAAEFGYGLLRQRNNYRLNDAISSLSQGLLSQAVAVCTQLFQIGLYEMLYPHVAVFDNAAIWDLWYGWLIALVLYDFFDYWLHRVSHESAIFWAAHVVHHQSQCFNLSTALRQESFYPIMGWIFFIPMAIIGVPPELFGIVGLVVILYQFWIHTEHIGKLGWFDRVFSSPSNHRVHHATNPRYLDKNYGAILIIWDRLFGTFEEETEPCVYGTVTPLNSWNPLWSVAVVYASLWAQLRTTAGWRDKLRVLYKGPGWQAGQGTAPVATPVNADRFNPAIGRLQGWAACALFAIALVATCLFLWWADDATSLQNGLFLAGMAVWLWMIGAVLRDSVVIKVPFKMSSFWVNGAAADEDEHTRAQRRVDADRRFDWASD